MASTVPIQSPTAKQDAFITKWFPKAEAHYKNMVKRSSDELWSTSAIKDANAAFIIYRIFCSEFSKHREAFMTEFISAPLESRENMSKTWARFCVQMKKLREATNVLLLVWEAYKNGDMGVEKQQWYRTLPDDFRYFVESFPKDKLGPAAKMGLWS
ncbi:hypothetical protein AC578_5976 [Pseudocercospora eumusae]|uniref:Uncharacterized protein n=1 Tax=Pseudocercospora eumusae TaxID=321146 RepID=A0A139HID1_9PEZI|nr:hypothetical protein AC578_5976 [Pseudocercospora eumusae]